MSTPKQQPPAGVTFEDPPPTRRGHHTPTPRPTADTGAATALRARPGEWAVITVRTTAARTTAARAAVYAYGVSRGMRHAYRPAGAFEAKARTVDGEHRVYARYVGDTSTRGGQ